MVKTASTKKVIAVLAALSMIIAILGANASLTANASTTDVSLYSSEVYFCKYGIVQRVVYVKTDANSYDQKVTIHYNPLEGQAWEDTEAEYFTTLSDGSKLWKASFNSYNPEYAIKYEANGETIWDNNGGMNYTNENLGTAPVTVNRGGFFTLGYNRIYATLQNYAYDKDVVVRYTMDNWNTYTDIPMSYDSTNANGTENWVATLYSDSFNFSGFEYCVCYEVNGQTYWANNFNQNYDTSYRVYP